MILCDYGCGQKAKFQFKNGKWCCDINTSLCPAMKKLNSQKNKGRIKSKEEIKKISESNKGRKLKKEHKDKLSKSHKGKTFSTEHKEKISKANKGRVFSQQHKKKLKDRRFGVPGFYKGKKLSTEHKIKISKSNKGKQVSNKTKQKLRIKNLHTISYIKKRWPIFSIIEEMRYNPDKPGKREIQVHCKNHNCPNSKEQGGWFTPTPIQLYERKRGIELIGNDGSYFYCCEKCKIECPLYNLKNDPCVNNKTFYTYNEYQTFRTYVLERDDYECQYCGEKAEHVHHERPQKLEPFFALDPDLAWSVCKKCHYKYGHQEECSTGNLSNRICL